MLIPRVVRHYTNQKRSGFTLAEVLAALAFMAIVIPVAVQGLRVATLSGQVALRKGSAARLADRLLNEAIVVKSWKESTQSGTIREGPFAYRWQIRNEAWEKDAIRLVSIQVTFPVQGQDYDVRLTTLLDNSQP